VYDSKDSEAQEFIVAGLEFIRQFSQLRPMPFYKYLPSSSYNNFVKATGRMRELGMPYSALNTVNLFSV